MHILPIPDCLIGSGVITQVPDALRELGARKVMVVTDPGVIKAGIYESVKAVLDAAGITIVLHDKVQSDPSTTTIDALGEEARQAEAAAVVGLGGGSSLDSAKMAAALVANTRPVSEYLFRYASQRGGPPYRCGANNSRHRQRSHSHRHSLRRDGPSEKRIRLAPDHAALRVPRSGAHPSIATGGYGDDGNGRALSRYRVLPVG